jgi:Fe2+ or Zn2+ uptake regulation protein
MSGRSGAVTYSERIAIRRELVLSVLTRRPGLTAREIEAELPELSFGVLGPYNDLAWLREHGEVQSIAVTTRTVLWHLVTPEASDG